MCFSCACYLFAITGTRQSKVNIRIQNTKMANWKQLAIFLFKIHLITTTTPLQIDTLF